MPAMPACPAAAASAGPRRRPSTASVTTSASAVSETVAVAGAGVTERVREALLRDAVDHELDVRRQRRQLRLKVALDAQAALLVDPRAERDQRVDQPEVVERLGTQLARDPAHLVEALADAVRDPRKLLRELRVARRRRARPGASPP